MRQGGCIEIMNLKPCPFCGSEKELINDSKTLGFVSFVKCLECGAQGPEKHTNDSAIYAWGIRINWRLQPVNREREDINAQLEHIGIRLAILEKLHKIP